MAPMKWCIKIHEHCKVAPSPSSSSTNHLSLPLTFFDLFWLKFHPVERIFFYSLPHSDPSSFFDKVVPKLKSSLSHTLHHFLPLAGNIIWPSDSPKPIIQFNPNEDDGVSFTLAQCDDADLDFNFNFNQPRDAIESHNLVPHLDSSDSFASVISLQITLFPNSGFFCIGISTHHAVLDGKSSTMFIKAWASICKSGVLDSPNFLPFLDREGVIIDPNGLESLFINNWNRISSYFDNGGTRSVKIMSNAFQPTIKDSFRATFELTRADLDKINKRVLSKWSENSSKPPTLSTFVLACAYVSVCIAKAIQEAEKEKKQKFSFGFPVDCRARLVPPIPDNYFGNCVSNHVVDAEPEDFTKDDGVVIVAKKIYGKIKMMDNEKGVLDGVETLMSRLIAMISGGVKGMGVAGSTRFGVYETDFGWGRPVKVEITSIDRGLTIGLSESKDGRGGVEIGLVLGSHVMGLFQTIFREGLL